MRPSRLLITLFAASIVLLAATLVAPIAHAREAGFRALLFTKTAPGAYRHGSIPAGVTMFQDLAAKDGFTLVHSENSAVFNDAELATYDVVIMFQTSGMVWDTEAQRVAMQKYVRGGGGVVAIHNATDMNIESAFPWWDQVVMAGAHMTAHSATVPGTAKVADRVHPSTAGLPERWQRTEEWYNFDRNMRGERPRPGHRGRDDVQRGSEQDGPRPSDLVVPERRRWPGLGHRHGSQRLRLHRGGVPAAPRRRRELVGRRRTR